MDRHNDKESMIELKTMVLITIQWPVSSRLVQGLVSMLPTVS